MKEIKIIINNGETVCENPFWVYIDGKEIENLKEFNLSATKVPVDKGGFINMDEVINYTVKFFVPYFEE